MSQMQSHSRSQTYDGSQNSFQFPNTSASATIATFDNVSIPITSMGSDGSNQVNNNIPQSSGQPQLRYNNDFRGDIKGVYGRNGSVKRAHSVKLKRSSAIKRKVGWLSRKFKQLGPNFLKLLHKMKSWRIVSRKKITLYKSTNSVTRTGTSSTTSRLLRGKLTKNRPVEQGKSIAELRREIDHWYVPQVEVEEIGLVPPVPPPHRIITPVAELPQKNRSTSQVSRTSSRASSKASIQTPDISLEAILYGYFAKVIANRIQTKLSIAQIPEIPPSRQSSYINREIVSYSSSIQSLSSIASQSSVDDESEIGSMSSLTSVSSDSASECSTDSMGESDFFSNAVQPTLPVHSMLNSHHKFASFEIKRNHMMKEAGVSRASSLPTWSQAHQLRRVSEYIVEV